MGILVLHVSMYTSARVEPPFSAGDSVLRGLHLGVTLFFVLSGFLLFSAWVDPQRRPLPLARYLKRRTARVLPAYWVALAGAAAMLAGTGSPLMPRLHDIPVLLTLQQDLVPSVPDVIPPAWTLGIELTYYAVLPLLGLGAVRFVRRTGWRIVACLVVIAASVAVNPLAQYVDAIPTKLQTTVLGYFYGFAAGMLAATVAVAWRPGRVGRWALIAGGTALVVFNAALHVPLRSPLTEWVRDAPAALGCAALVLAVAARPQRLLGSPGFRFVGERSYGLYLWHFPIIVALARRDLLPAGLWSGLLVVTPLALLAADLSWRMVELPAIRFARRKRPRVEAEVAAPVGAPVPAGVTSGPHA